MLISAEKSLCSPTPQIQGPIHSLSWPHQEDHGRNEILTEATHPEASCLLSFCLLVPEPTWTILIFMLNQLVFRTWPFFEFSKEIHQHKTIIANVTSTEGVIEESGEPR